MCPSSGARAAALVLGAALLATGCSGGGGSSSGTVEVSASFPRQDALYYHFKGPHSALFVVVELLDAPALFAADASGLAEAQALASDLIDACSANSHGLFALDVDVTWPPLAIPKTTADYDPLTGLVELRADALAAAAQAGYAPEAYDREVIWSPLVWSGAGIGVGRTVWMPHKLPWVLFHEIGHTLAWGHANFWDGDPLGAGTPVEYGDLFDPMGTGATWSAFHHSGPWFKIRAGWLAKKDVALVEEPDTYLLGDLEHPGAGLPVALRIRRDANLDYWIFRRASEPLVASGVVIARTGHNPAAFSLLLDMHPGSSGPEAEDAALLPGEAFDDPAAAIRVENATPPGGPLALAVTVDPARQASLDLVPVVHVLEPAFAGEPLAGVVPFEAEVYDLEAGSASGAGIAQVELSLWLPIQDPFQLVASTVLTAPPYRWTFDTTALVDQKYFFGVEATASDGGERTVLVPILVDNPGDGGALPALAETTPTAVESGPLASAFGIVLDARGRPAAGARIEVAPAPGTTGALDCGPRADPAPLQAARADAAGGYALDGLPAGRLLRWVVELPDARRIERRLELSRGPNRLDFDGRR